MNEKSKIISVAALVILLIVGAFIVFRFLLVPKEVGPETISSPGVIPQLPSPPNSGITSRINVGNAANKDEIKNAFNEYKSKAFSEDIKKDQVNWYEFFGKDGKIILLDQFSSSVGLAVNNNLKKVLDKRNYDTFFCAEGGSGRSFGLMLNEKLLPTYPHLHADVVSWMKEWESSIFKDTHTVLLPNVDFNPAELDQKLNFKEGKYRYAEINLPDGRKSSINYQIIGDSIIISTSVACLDKASNDVEDQVP